MDRRPGSDIVRTQMTCTSIRAASSYLLASMSLRCSPSASGNSYLLETDAPFQELFLTWLERQTPETLDTLGSKPYS